MAELFSSGKGSQRAAVDNLAAFSAMLGQNAPHIDSFVSSVNRLTTQLTEEEFARRLTESVEGLNALMARIERGDGTLGRLMDDPALYDSLTVASSNLAALLADLKEYPGRYVHFSLFGRDPEKMKARAERKAARLEEKKAKEAEKSGESGAE